MMHMRTGPGGEATLHVKHMLLLRMVNVCTTFLGVAPVKSLCATTGA